MKINNLYKIITLFAVIFIVGVYLSLITVKSSLNKFETQKKIVEIERDTKFLLKADKKTG